MITRLKTIFAAFVFMLFIPAAAILLGQDNSCNACTCGTCEVKYQGKCISCAEMATIDPSNNWRCYESKCVQYTGDRLVGN